jgi:HSP20 family protein
VRETYGRVRCNGDGGKEDSMDIVRWDPFKEMEEVTERLGRFFNRPAVRGLGQEALVAADWTPLVDIAETDKEYLVKVELPEIPKEAVKVEIREGVLFIQGERRKETEEKGRRFHRVERAYGKFLRSFTVPQDVEEDKVSADFKEGVLFVKMPKTTVARPKAFEVKVA